MNENVLPEVVDQGAFGGGLVDTWSHGKLVFGHMHKTQCKWQRIGAQFEACRTRVDFDGDAS